MSDTITIRRDGIEATVKVGDVVPMTDGSRRTVNFVDPPVILRLLSDNLWEHYAYNADGLPRNARWPALDIAKLAEQQAALAAAPPSVPAEKLRELVQRWQALACNADEGVKDAEPGGMTSFILSSAAGTFRDCAADVLKLLERDHA